jgi:hypothetical protein
MLTQPRRIFLQSRIMDLRQALFYNDSQSVLKFPVSVINVLFVDDVHQVWFMVHRPTQYLNEFEKEFRARLDFYKKGKDYYLQVIGKATVVCDPEELNNVYGLDNETKKLASTSMALIRMKINKTFYYPIRKQPPKAKPANTKLPLHPSAVVKRLQYIIKDIIPVFESH